MSSAPVLATLSASDLAMVVVVILAVAALCAVLFAVQALLRALRRLNAALADLNDEALPLLSELDEVVRTTAADLDRVEVVLDRLDSVSSSVEGVSRVASAAVSSPVIKVLSLGSGTSAAARRLRTRRNG